MQIVKELSEGLSHEKIPEHMFEVRTTMLKLNSNYEQKDKQLVLYLWETKKTTRRT